jgi:hypothetical protein
MSKIEVNTVEPQCGTTLTLGACGQTVALGSGASQTGFGRTGTVDWITTPKVTGDSPITGVTGKGYFMNTTAGTITINLPAGSAGDIISLMDYAATWQTNNVTVSPNGSEKIGGINANVDLSTEGQSVTLVYVDSTQGWLNTMDSTSNVRAASYVTATGGTPCSGAISGDYKIHTFTGPGTFCVSGFGPGSSTVDYMVIAGGGAGGGSTPPGGCAAGGGGAGGFRESVPSPAAWTASPLANPGNARPVTIQGYPITVGGGGVGAGNQTGASGSLSTFSDIDSAGGGGGGYPPSPAAGANGGSGGGGSNGPKGCGNTPPVAPPQGKDGGAGSGAGNTSGGGGGGATVAGVAGSTACAGEGGDGATTSIDATPTVRAGGGGGGTGYGTGSQQPAPNRGGGGPGGGGQGANNGAGCAGTVNTGSGGGGSSGYPGGNHAGGNGGSGVVILRYKFQN